MDGLIQIEILILELIAIVSVVAIVVRRSRIPYTAALLLAGLRCLPGSHPASN